MEFKDYLKSNGVEWQRNNQCWIGTEKIIGKKVWVCDYRNGRKIIGKPVRNISPREAEIRPISEHDSSYYHYSPVCFKQFNINGIEKPNRLAPYDNTAPGVALKIFYSRDECIEYFTLQVEKAIKERKTYIAELLAETVTIQKSLEAEIEKLKTESKISLHKT